MKKVLYTFLLVMTLASPAATFGATANSGGTSASTPTNTAPPLDYSGFVKCDGVLRDKNQEPGRQTKCDFAALMDTVVKAINWLFYISIPFAVAMTAYAGVLFMTGVPANISKAKGVFGTMVIGFIIMATAWFAVRQFVEWLVSDPAATTFLGK
jgi:hypothetical protein